MWSEHVAPAITDWLEDLLNEPLYNENDVPGDEEDEEGEGDEGPSCPLPDEGNPDDEKPDIGEPGTDRNPDGTRKTEEEQYEQILDAKRKGRLPPDVRTDKSRQRADKKLKDYLGDITGKYPKKKF